MPSYEIDFSYKVAEYGTTLLEADDEEQAEQYAREYFVETYANDTVSEFMIDNIKEIKR